MLLYKELKDIPICRLCRFVKPIREGFAKGYKYYIETNQDKKFLIKIFDRQLMKRKSGNMITKLYFYESYTFGAIKVFDTDDNASEGYENIHNLYNYYDSFGPNGNQSRWGASSLDAKFGHTDIFYPDPVPEEDEKFISSVNHGMSTYKDAINDELINCEYIDEN